MPLYFMREAKSSSQRVKAADDDDKIQKYTKFQKQNLKSDDICYMETHLWQH